MNSDQLIPDIHRYIKRRNVILFIYESRRAFAGHKFYFVRVSYNITIRITETDTSERERVGEWKGEGRVTRPFPAHASGIIRARGAPPRRGRGQVGRAKERRRPHVGE